MPGPIRALLRAEGGAELVVLVLAYRWTGASWWLFGALFFVPDVGFLGYLAGPRVGAIAYNGLHVVLLPALLGVAAWVLAWSPGVSVALIWAAHIQFDRMMGYGLKYPTAFCDTHLGRVGRPAERSSAA